MTFTVHGIPIPKARPRVMRGGYTFTPKRTQDAERAVATEALMAKISTKEQVLGVDCQSRLFVRVVAYGARGNADLDNIFKLCTDGMQGVLYKNDFQIDHGEMLRQPSMKGKEHTEITVEVLP